jgi:iron complex transport system substrate-binding protein
LKGGFCILKFEGKQKYFTILLCAYLFAAAASCKAPQAAEQYPVEGSRAEQSPPEQLSMPKAGRVMTDDLGRKVELPQTVSRAISLAPSLTEIVFAVGGGDKLIGDTTYCNYPAEAEKIQKVGDTISPNLEAIIALKPDVVLVTTASQIETFSKRLEEQHIAVFITDPKDLEGVYRSISTIGEILGTTEKAETLVAGLKKRVAAVEAKTESAPPYRVFVQISEEPLYAAGGPTFITDLIQRAGGFSVTEKINDAFPKLSKETALAMQPDVILISAGDGNQKENSVFAGSPAVRNKKVFLIDGDLLSRPGPRSVDALEQIAEKLHGKR